MMSLETEKELVDINVDDKNVATLTLNNLPANSLSYEMCTSISTAIKSIEKNPKVQSMIVKSSNPSILSAGLDLNELYKPDTQRLPLFWSSFQQVFLDLYGSRLATMIAIEGHAPAAGCMIAMAGDYRIMAKSSIDGNNNGKMICGTIGLNEAKFGIVAPPFLGELMLRTIGIRRGEEALSLGTLFSPEDALDVGLVDRIVDKDLVLDECYKEGLKWAKIPPQARVASKMLVRKEHLDRLISTREDDINHFCNFIQNDMVQAGLGAYLKSLKKK